MVEQRVINLFSVIGKKLIKQSLNFEYNNYIKRFKDKSQDYILVLNGNSVSLKIELQFTGFILRFPSLFHRNDYVKYALDITELILVHLGIFNSELLYDYEEKKGK